MDYPARRRAVEGRGARKNKFVGHRVATELGHAVYPLIVEQGTRCQIITPDSLFRYCLATGRILMVYKSRTQAGRGA